MRALTIEEMLLVSGGKGKKSTARDDIRYG